MNHQAGLLLLGLLAVALPSARALFGLDGSGGTFRYGHVHYRVIRENIVEFTIEAAFSREVDTSYFYGSAVDGYAQLGDKITMTGRETPEFDFGDNNLISKLTMDVTSYSVRENFVMGKVVVQHKYDTPNNAGNPWLARFTGCCRYSRLKNNADNPWELIAQVDLQKAPASPRVSVLPVVSVPMEPDLESSQRLPKVTLPATITANGQDPPKTRAMYWSKDNPFDVGNAASFTNGFASLSLERFFDKDALKCCTNRAADGCPEHVKKNPSVSPGCFARLLTTDFQLRTLVQSPDARTVSPAMTIEGWVKIRSAKGGVVLSTGRAAGRENCAKKGTCAVALIYIKVNATHVTVGHETSLNDQGTAWKLNTVDFAIASSASLVEQLTDAGFYLESAGDPTLVGKFVHVAVVRKSLTGPSHSKGCEPGEGACDARDGLHEQEFWFSTYKVYVNGFMLEVAKFPFCGAGGKCTNGARYGGFASPAIVATSGCYVPDTAVEDTTEDNGCKVALTIGESNPVPGPRRPSTSGTVPADDSSGRCYLNEAQGFCNDNFGNETALLLGAYRGADSTQAESYFDGLLDEWRFWNGERSRADILNSYRRPIYPGMSNNYGDPTIVPEGQSGMGRMIGGRNYETTSALIALYSFDWSKSSAKDPELCPAKNVGCLYATLTPTFPLKPDTTDLQRQWTSTWTAKIDANHFGVKHDHTDASGVMFYKGGSLYRIEDSSKGVVTMESRPAPGMYQVTVQVAASPDSPSVPVDFIINIVDSIYEVSQIAYKLNDKTQFPINDYIPTISFAAPVVAVADDASTAEFVGSHQLPEAAQSNAVLGTCQNTGTCWNLLDAYSYPKKARAFAGFGVEVKIVGRDMQGVYSAALQQTADYRDTKVGFSLGPAPDSARFTSIKDTNPSEMMMSWTPCAHELGNTILCMDAVDYHIKRDEDPSKNVVDNAASSNMRCLDFEVVKDPAPKFEAGIPETLHLYMGREGILVLRAWDDNCLDSVTIDVATGSQLPAGAVLDMQQKGSGFGRSCTSVTRTMRWTPAMKMGGFKNTTCFVARDTGGSLSCGAKTVPQTAVHCVHLDVQRCKYALQMDQQLQEISALFGVDWMRLWSLNMAISHPDYVVYNQQIVSVGHLYRVAPNERLDHIAQRLGMSMEQLRDLNFDIAEVQTVETGQELCVVPNSCRGQKDTLYSSMVYKDDKFFAAAKTGQ